MALAKFLYPLKDELVSDPLGRGYSDMTAQEAANDMTTAYRTRKLESLSGDEVFRQTDTDELNALGDTKKGHWINWTAKDSIRVGLPNNRDFIESVFGVDSVSEENIMAAMEQSITRAEELGYNSIDPAWVTRCREDM